MTVIEHLNTCGSTQDEVVKRVLSHSPPFWVSSAVQTSGRGSRGKSWQSTPGGIYMSGMLPSLEGYVPGHTVLVGAVLTRFLESLLAGTPGKVSQPSKLWLKWPNDILLELGSALYKVAGVLCESQSRGGQTFIIVGMGINAAQADLFVQHETTSLGLPAASLGVGTCGAGLQELATRLAETIESSWHGPLKQAIDKAWQSVRPVPVWHKDGETLLHAGISPEGFLQLKKPGGGQLVVWQQREQGWQPGLLASD